MVSPMPKRNQEYTGLTSFSRPSMPFSLRRTLLIGTECGTATVSYKRSRNVRGSMKVFQGRTLTLSMSSMLHRCIGLPIEWYGSHCYHLFFFRVKIWLSSFSVRSSIENQREPLWIVHRARDLRYVRNFGEYLSLTYWRDGIADILYLSSSTDSLLTSFKRSKSDVCILSGWPSLVSAITNMAFPCAGQPYKPVLSFKPWLLKMYWKSRLKVHLYV